MHGAKRAGEACQLRHGLQPSVTMKALHEKLFSPKSGLTVSLAKVIALLFLGLLCVQLFQDSDINRYIGSYLPSRENFLIFPSAEHGEILNLIYRIREQVVVAAKGSDVSFRKADREAWNQQFPCRSRSELGPVYERRKHVKGVPVNKGWQHVLDEYAILHRVCMSRIGDPKNYFSAQNDSTGCRFLIAEAHFGLGNKLLHMSSLFVYAVLTQRVMLIPASTSVPPVLCEPFAGSSWSISDDFLHLVQSNRATADQLYAAMDEDLSSDQRMTIYASQGGGVWGPEIRFWCDTEQSLFSEVTWLTFDGCLHFLPKLYAVANFRSTMEALFPGRITLTHVLRTVMLPSDAVWERILQVKQVYLENADKLVGVQVRFLHGQKQYKNSNMPVNKQIVRCLWDNDILPEMCPSDAATNTTDSKFANCSSSASSLSPHDPNPPPVTKVLIASLFLGFHDYLTNFYLRDMGKKTRKETIGLVQLSHEKTQGSGVEVDGQALVEIITLSFSDVLLVTPLSTFGGVAQAYGGLIPYFIEYNATESLPCQRGVTIEPCYLGAISNYDCRYDAPKQSPVVDFVPYLQRCLFVDVGPGYGMLMRNADESINLPARTDQSIKI